METETNLVFVCIRTGTIDGIDSSARVVDLDSCGFVPDGDDWADDVTVQNLAESHGVSVADLWAAWERQRRVESVIGGVYDIDDDGEIVLFTVGGERAGDEDYDNAHRCDDCGVTGGGVAIATAAAGILADHYGIDVAVES